MNKNIMYLVMVGAISGVITWGITKYFDRVIDARRSEHRPVNNGKIFDHKISTNRTTWDMR